MRVIADCCSNHLGNKDTMMQMIDSAANIGCDFVKFQLYDADNLNKNWNNYQEAYDYYKKCQLTDKNIYDIIIKCESRNTIPLFTAFDLGQAVRLRNFRTRCVKIASPDMANAELIEYCLCNFLTVFVSTGMHYGHEIKRLFNKYKNHFQTGRMVPFYCRSEYPAPEYGDKDMDAMTFIRDNSKYWGISDHSENTDNILRLLWYAFAPDYIERHFTLEKNGKKDDVVSSDPDDMAKLTNYPFPELSKSEIESRKYIGRWKNE